LLMLLLMVWSVLRCVSVTNLINSVCNKVDGEVCKFWAAVKAASYLSKVIYNAVLRYCTRLINFLSIVAIAAEAITKSNFALIEAKRLFTLWIAFEMLLCPSRSSSMRCALIDQHILLWHKMGCKHDRVNQWLKLHLWQVYQRQKLCHFWRRCVS
jgi:hypothetical protein